MILVVITVGCCTSIHGEMKFSMVGFTCQISGQVAEVFKVLIQQMVMQGFKVDPLTMVLIMSPLCMVALSFGLAGVFKDICIVLVAALAFHAEVTHVQYLG